MKGFEHDPGHDFQHNLHGQDTIQSFIHSLESALPPPAAQLLALAVCLEATLLSWLLEFPALLIFPSEGSRHVARYHLWEVKGGTAITFIAF